MSIDDFMVLTNYLKFYDYILSFAGNVVIREKSTIFA